MTEIVKCSSCGAKLSAFSSSCEACGFEFVNDNSNSSIINLVNRLEEIDKEVDAQGFNGKKREREVNLRRARVIRDFPVPNVRADLQQLIYFIQPKLMEAIKPDPNIQEWRAKFMEVLNRAKKAYENDHSALDEFSRLEDSLAISLGDSIQFKAKRNPLFVSLLLGIVILCLIGIVNWWLNKSAEQSCLNKYTQESNLEKNRIEKLYSSALEASQNKNYSNALMVLNQVHWDLPDGACNVDENQKEKGLWEEKRKRESSQIQEIVNQEKALATEEKAASRAAENRVRAAVEADAARVRAAAANEIARREAMEKVIKKDKAW
jgi:hypothetical protein